MQERLHLVNAPRLPGTAVTAKREPAGAKRSALGPFALLVLAVVRKGVRARPHCLHEGLYSPSPAGARVGGVH